MALPRHHAPNMPSGEMSKDMVGARSAAGYKMLIDLASATDGRNAQLRGHWASLALYANAVSFDQLLALGTQ